MTSLLVVFLFIFLHCGASLCQQLLPCESENASNTWKIEAVSFQRWDNKTFPNVGVRFHLYRSYFIPCPITAWDPLRILILPKQTCGWIISNSPVECTNGMIDQEGSGQRPSSNWATCDTYPQAPEGERKVPVHVKEMLKWRVLEFLEEPNFENRINPNDSLNRELDLPFQHVKIEIYNAVPFNSSSIWTTVQDVKLYRGVLEIERNHVECSKWYGKSGIKGPDYQCTRPESHEIKCFGNLGAIQDSFLNRRVNITEEVISLHEFKKRIAEKPEYVPPDPWRPIPPSPIAS